MINENVPWKKAKTREMDSTLGGQPETPRLSKLILLVRHLRWPVKRPVNRFGLATTETVLLVVMVVMMMKFTGHVKPKLILTGLLKEPSGNVSGTWKELEPKTGVTAPP